LPLHGNSNAQVLTAIVEKKLEKVPNFVGHRNTKTCHTQRRIRNRSFYLQIAVLRHIKEQFSAIPPASAMR
jgi:hypothetical protein